MISSDPPRRVARRHGTVHRDAGDRRIRGAIAARQRLSTGRLSMTLPHRPPRGGDAACPSDRAAQRGRRRSRACERGRRCCPGRPRHADRCGRAGGGERAGRRPRGLGQVHRARLLKFAPVGVSPDGERVGGGAVTGIVGCSGAWHPGGSAEAGGSGVGSRDHGGGAGGRGRGADRCAAGGGAGGAGACPAVVSHVLSRRRRRLYAGHRSRPPLPAGGDPRAAHGRACARCGHV
jgi:hypothetical protein